MIRAGLSIGFSVNELADIFSERNGGGAPWSPRSEAGC